MHFRKFVIPLFVTACGLVTSTNATVALSSVFGTNMVIQRDKAVPVSGSASPGKVITVIFNSQTKTTTSDSGGKWKVTLDPMTVNAIGGTFSAAEAGGNTVSLGNVVVGDVWICSGQSNMDMSLASCNRKSQDEDTANFPKMRTFRAPLSFSGEPSDSVTGSWTVCTAGSAGSFSAIAFYFGREICKTLDSTIPIGLYVASVGGTNIDLWLAPEGLTDIPVLNPLFSQSILPNGPCSLFNGMVYPYSPLPAKGLIWYQGENAERTVQSPDSYYLKMKALAQGYKRMTGAVDFPFYFVQLAYWGRQQTSPAPVLDPGGGWSADTRIQQTNAMAIPHSGMASAMDVGSSLDGDQIWDGWHPKTKQDVGQRLAIWALKNDYGQPIGETSGPILRNVTAAGKTLVCSFDHLGAGLMVGSKIPYQPTIEVPGGVLDKFSIAGANGVWFNATAVISGDTVVLSSTSVASPTKAAYACWQNPVGANLYNKAGLPASPFYLDDVNAKFTIAASAGAGGSISPAGTETYLKRHSTLYTITPDAGKFIQDVLVNGVSVGAVASYTFDPLYANQTITAAFASVEPGFTVNTSSSGGGSITPNGALIVNQGGSQVFEVNASPGVITNLTVDGKPMGQRDRHTFTDVRENHSISATFTFPITAQAGYGGTITPGGTTLTTYGSDVTYTISALAGFAISKVIVDGVNIGPVTSHAFTNVTASHSIAATFTGVGGGGSIPQTDKLYTSFLTKSLPAPGPVSNWLSYLPAGKSLTPIVIPTVEVIDGRKFVKNISTRGDGLDMGTVASAIPCTGATIVTVAKPVRFGADGGNWVSLVDMFYDRLVLGIMNGSGRVVVRRNGSLDLSTATIPDGQTTILSLVVQQNGGYKVYANGTEVMNVTGTSNMSSIVPGVAGAFANHVTLGRNSPDSWSTYNGYYGDTFIYTNALGASDRQQLETYLINQLTDSETSHTITATAGTGGSINPTGAVLVSEGNNQTFTVTADVGYAISGVIVDGTDVGAVSTHTFNGINGNHVISATFTATGNTPPTCSTISDQNLSVNTTTGLLAFTVGDAATPAGDLTVTAASSNEAVVPSAGIILDGSGMNRTLRVTPVNGATGTASISLTVSDGQMQVSMKFNVTVTAAAGGKGVSFNVGLSGELSTATAAGVVALNHWNNLTGSSPSATSVVDDAGRIVPGMTVTFRGNGNTFNNTGVPDQTMLSGFLTGSPMTARFNNIPYAIYDVYIYYAGFNNNNTYTLSWDARNANDGAILATRYSVRGTLAGPQLFPTPGLVQSNYETLAEAQSQSTAGNGGNWLKFVGLTAADLIIAETSDSFFNENGFSGIQIVNTSPHDDYSSWIAGFPGVGAATAIRDDADGDGVPNGVENYLGTDPSKADAESVLVSVGNFIFKFRHSRSNHPASDMTFTYRWSTDLHDWRTSGEGNAGGVVAQISTETVNDLTSPDNDTVEVTVSPAAGTTDRMFARLECSKLSEKTPETR